MTPPDITPTQQMVSSCTGALITSLLMTPFDVVKVRLQAQQANPIASRHIFCCDSLMEIPCECIHDPKSQLRGTLDAFIKIPQRDGIAGLWRGLAPTLVMSVPSTVLYFTTYDQLRLRLDQHMNSALSPSVSGLTARMIASSVISPLELVRTKAQSLTAPKYKDILHSIGLMVRSNGVFALWRGWVPTMWRDVPFSGIYWGLYEYIKKELHLRQGTHLSSTPEEKFIVSYMSGAISGAVAALATTPFDVIKTYQQIDLTTDAHHDHSMLTTTRRILKERGYRGMFAGVVPRIVRIAPACAIMIGTYEAGKAYFHDQNTRKRHIFN